MTSVTTLAAHLPDVRVDIVCPHCMQPTPVPLLNILTRVSNVIKSARNGSFMLREWHFFTKLQEVLYACVAYEPKDVPETSKQRHLIIDIMEHACTLQIYEICYYLSHLDRVNKHLMFERGSRAAFRFVFK